MAAILSGDPRCAGLVDRINPEAFSVPSLPAIWHMIRELRSSTGQLPPARLVREAIRNRYEEPERGLLLHRLKRCLKRKPDESEVKYIAKHAGDFAARQNLIRATYDVLPLLAKGDLAGVRKMFEQAVKQSDQHDANPVTLTRASSVRPKCVRWAWEGRIPLRAVTALVGEGGLGKSTLACTLAAGLTRGTLSGDLKGHPAAIFIATAEDTIDSVAVPRLMAARADLDRVDFVNVQRDDIEDSLSLPVDIQNLHHRIEEVGAKFLIIDPLVAFLPIAVDSHRDQHIRRVLAPLQRIAEETGCAIVAIMHLNKSEVRNVLMRIGGSVGFGNAARSVLLAAPDPQNSIECILAHGKTNWGIRAPSVGYRVDGYIVQTEDGPNKTGRLTWTGTATLSAEDLIGNDSRDDRNREVVEYLRELLTSGRKTAEEVEEARRNAGIGPSPWRRAQRTLKIIPQKDGMTGPWHWELPKITAPRTPASSAPSASSGGSVPPYSDSSYSSSSSSSKALKMLKASKVPGSRGGDIFAQCEEGVTSQGNGIDANPRKLRPKRKLRHVPQANGHDSVRGSR